GSLGERDVAGPAGLRGGRHQQREGPRDGGALHQPELPSAGDSPRPKAVPVQTRVGALRGGRGRARGLRIPLPQVDASATDQRRAGDHDRGAHGERRRRAQRQRRGAEDQHQGLQRVGQLGNLACNERPSTMLDLASERRRLAQQAGAAARRGARHRDEEQQLQARQVDPAGDPRRLRLHQVRLRVAREHAQQRAARDPEHAAVRAAAVRQQHRPEPGQLLGHSLRDHRLPHEAGERKVPAPQGSHS
ncbi:hypothetical protein AAVH_32744, partial [Aphelenchoides avenae]